MVDTSKTSQDNLSSIAYCKVQAVNNSDKLHINITEYITEN